MMLSQKHQDVKAVVGAYGTASDSTANPNVREAYLRESS